MKLITLLAFTASATALSLSAHGASVLVNNFRDPFPFINQHGELIPRGTGFIAVGTFGTLDNAGIAAGAGSIFRHAALAADFNQFGESFTFNVSDGFFGGLIEVPNLTDPTFVGKNVYLVVASGDSFESSLGSFNPGFFIVDSGTPFSADHPVAPNVDIFLDGIFSAGGQIVVGHRIPNIVSPAGVSDGAPLFVIPEPSVAVLLLPWIFALVFRRRRKAHP